MANGSAVPYNQTAYRSMSDHLDASVGVGRYFAFHDGMGGGAPTWINKETALGGNLSRLGAGATWADGRAIFGGGSFDVFRSSSAEVPTWNPYVAGSDKGVSLTCWMKLTAAIPSGGMSIFEIENSGESGSTADGMRLKLGFLPGSVVRALHLIAVDDPLTDFKTAGRVDRYYEFSPVGGIEDGRWHHFAWTWHTFREFATIFIDGVAAAQKPGGNQVQSPTSQWAHDGVGGTGSMLWIGKAKGTEAWDTVTANFIGEMADLDMWGEQLTPSQVGALYGAGTSDLPIRPDLH